MNLAGCRTSYDQGNLESGPLHFFCHMFHLSQRRGDQSAQSHSIHLMFFGCFDDILTRDHHSQVYNFIMIALKDDTHDILTDIMNISFYCRHQNLFLGLWFQRRTVIDQRGQDVDCFLHHTSALHHLGQKHFTVSKQLSHSLHPIHEGTFNNLYRIWIKSADLLYVRFQKIRYTFY